MNNKKNTKFKARNLKQIQNSNVRNSKNEVETNN